MHEKELYSVIYNIATVFCMNDFPCVNGLGTNVRSIAEQPFQKNNYVCNYLSKINCI